MIMIVVEEIIGILLLYDRKRNENCFLFSLAMLNFVNVSIVECIVLTLIKHSPVAGAIISVLIICSVYLEDTNININIIDLIFMYLKNILNALQKYLKQFPFSWRRELLTNMHLQITIIDFGKEYI